MVLRAPGIPITQWTKIGFRPGVGLILQHWFLNKMRQTFGMRGGTFQMASVGLTKVCDRMEYDRLFQILSRQNVPQPYTNLLHAVYEGQAKCVLTPDVGGGNMIFCSQCWNVHFIY